MPASTNKQKQNQSRKGAAYYLSQFKKTEANKTRKAARLKKKMIRLRAPERVDRRKAELEQKKARKRVEKLRRIKAQIELANKKIETNAAAPLTQSVLVTNETEIKNQIVSGK